MALPSRSHLLGLLLLLSLPPEGAAALAALSSHAAEPPVVPFSETGPGEAAGGSLEQRMRRIEVALRDGQPRPADGRADLAYTFVNGPGLGWGNGGFTNGGFYNGGFRNGGFANGGGFRNGGAAWRNGGGGGAWRNGGGFRNHW
jgi:rSAM-associated Gly-rich repeat protein